MSNTPGADLLNGGEAGKPSWPFRRTTLFRKVTGPFQRANSRPVGAGPDSGQPWPTASNLDEVTCLAEDLSQVYVDAKGTEHTIGDMVIELYQVLVEKK
jgi:hypothetical protein